MISQFSPRRPPPPKKKSFYYLVEILSFLEGWLSLFRADYVPSKKVPPLECFTNGFLEVGILALQSFNMSSWR